MACRWLDGKQLTSAAIDLGLFSLVNPTDEPAYIGKCGSMRKRELKIGLFNSFFMWQHEEDLVFRSVENKES